MGRPGLRVEACAGLGKIEAQLGNCDRATQRFTEAVQILKERSLHLSPANRQSFTERFIEPIEAERNHLSSSLSDPAPRYFTQLRRFANLISARNDQIETGKEILKIIKEFLPDTAGKVLIRNSSSGAFRTVAVLGRCSKGGENLLPGSWGNGQVFFPDPAVSGSKPCSIGIPLCSQDQVCGRLYLERQTGSFSEGEIDFLSCLASIAEVQVNCGIENRKEPTSGSSLVIKGVLAIVGEHPEMIRLFGEIRRVAAADSTVLLFGESGTGKELVAKAVHYISNRRQQRFVPINCSALPESLIESELFGHTRGSFTGAFNDRKGLFESASGGTLFLDEIATMPTSVQTRLLRVFEDRMIRRIGDNRERPTDVRIVAATNQPLMDLVRKQAFREDLFHRLNVCQITIAPLRK